MRPKPHAVVSETRRDLVRLDKLTSNRYISLIASPIDGLSRTGGVVQKPAGTVLLSSAEGEALLAQVRQSNLPPADAGMVEQIIRMYFWLVFALQEAKLSVKRLRNLLFGSSAQPKGRPESEGEATSSEAPGQAAGEEEAVPVAEVAPRLETTGREAGSGASESEGQPKPPGGHRAGTGRLGAEASVGAE